MSANRLAWASHQTNWATSSISFTTSPVSALGQKRTLIMRKALQTFWQFQPSVERVKAGQPSYAVWKADQRRARRLAAPARRRIWMASEKASSINSIIAARAPAGLRAAIAS